MQQQGRDHSDQDELPPLAAVKEECSQHPQDRRAHDQAVAG